jgi:hypothetical protein
VVHDEREDAEDVQQLPPVVGDRHHQSAGGRSV